MDLKQFIQKIPKPVLVISVLLIALVIFVMNNPLKDECEIKIVDLEKSMRGVLVSVRGSDKRTKFAQIDYWKNNCQTGNSIGSCNDYFSGLRKLSENLRYVPDKCIPKYLEENPSFIPQISDAVKVMALVAWGDKPPTGVQNRSGWLTDADITTFCRLKTFFEKFTESEDFKSFRNKVYAEYPDEWPSALNVEERNPEIRPKALKSPLNSQGKYDAKEIYERSLFSYRCDIYL